MDEIQKVLVKAGRKDLAQKYYLKVAKKGKLSDNDLDTFQAIADDAGGELYRSYSGRGMFGDTCIGITGDATNIIEQAGAHGIKGARTDSMGKEDIVYWPNYPDDQST
jgi:hypothetical protein